MPTMDEVVGNLGEPLECVECRLGDDDGTHDKDATANANLEDRGTEDLTLGTADLEAGPSSGGSRRSTADVQIMDSVLSVN